MENMQDLSDQITNVEVMDLDTNDNPNKSLASELELPVSAEKVASESNSDKDDKKTVQFKARKRLPGAVRKRAKEQYLRRKIIPKSPYMAINELKDICITNFKVSKDGFKHVATATVNSKQYSMEAASKKEAINLMFEEALREYYVEKSKTTEDPNDSQTDDECYFPMTSLASLAVHKLLKEWANKGYDLPYYYTKHNGNITPESSTPKPLPANWLTMHPVSLLNNMFPDAIYQNQGQNQDSVAIQHLMTVSVNGVTFKCSGRSKKIAKRRLAVQACNQLLGTTYEE